MYKKIYSFLIFLSLAGLAYGGMVYNPQINSGFDMIQTVEEEDGAPSVPVATIIKVPNTTLTDNADGTASLNFGILTEAQDLDAVLTIGDTADTESITLTAGTLTASTLTDGTLTITGGNITTATTTTQSPNDNSTKLATTAYADTAAAGGGATVALDNLASVQINTTLLSDGADTDSLGTVDAEWLNLYIGDAGKIYLGLGQDASINRSAANEMTLTATSGITVEDVKMDGGVITGASLSAASNVIEADTVTNATLTTAITVDTGTVGLTGAGANTSVLTLAAGASSIEGTNSGDNTVCTSGAATTAETLKTARAINGVDFNGSQAITVTAAAGTLTGATLKI